MNSNPALQSIGKSIWKEKEANNLLKKNKKIKRHIRKEYLNKNKNDRA